MGTCPYLLLLLHMMWIVDTGLAAIGGGNEVGETAYNTEWQQILKKHLCPVIECQGWCDCTEIDQTVSLTNAMKTRNMCNTNFTTGKFMEYDDCSDDVRLNGVCFKWKKSTPPYPPNPSRCIPTENLLTCLKRINETAGLYWSVCLDGNTCLNVSDLCDGVPQRDSCDLCARHATSTDRESSPRHPGRQLGSTASPEGSIDSNRPTQFTETTSLTGNRGNSSSNEEDSVFNIPNDLKTAFIIGVCVGVVIAVVLFIVICCLIVYIRKKMNRQEQSDLQHRESGISYHVDVNQYSTVDHPLRGRGRGNGETQAVFTISPQTSIESGSPTMHKKSKKTKRSKSEKGAARIQPTAGRYTEYYPNRAAPSYAGLQSVASDSALVVRANGDPIASPFTPAPVYQEPGVVVPKAGYPAFFDNCEMSSSHSFNSFKLTGEYTDPRLVTGQSSKRDPPSGIMVKETFDGSSGTSSDSTVNKHFKQKCDDNTTSPTSSMWRELKKGKQKKVMISSCKATASENRQCLGSPDGQEGTLFHELVQTLKKKKSPVVKSESTPIAIELENPYAEVGEAFPEPCPEFPMTVRQRSYSQPVVTTLPGYRTYEEIKLPQSTENDVIANQDSNVLIDSNPQYYVLEDRNSDSPKHDFQNSNNTEGTQYFELEKPSSLPLDKKKKKRVLNQENMLYTDQVLDKTATLFLNDRCATSSDGGGIRHFDLCVDSDSNSSQINGVNVKSLAYFQIEKPRHRASLGSTIQDYMSSSETVFVNEGNRVEGTLTFYPGGRKRSSTYSLEEQAYDKLNRSARSSRVSSRRTTLSNSASILSPTEEYNMLSRSGVPKSTK